MRKFEVAAIAMAIAAMSAPAHPQMNAAPGQRQFDLVSGILFTCASATGFAWTGEACDKLSGEFKKRAEAAKLAFVEVPITADFRTKKLETVDGFDRDKAVRVFWNFTEDADAKGVIKASLSANRIWEPTPKEIPNAAPGQRIPLNFYAQSAMSKPGIKLKDMQPYLDIITESFFKVGETRN